MRTQPRVRFEHVRFAYDARRADPARRRFRDPARRHGRGGRPFRLRQVDAGAPAVPLLRRRRRPHHDHRCGRRPRATSATTRRHSVRAAIAIVPQDTVLFNDTIYYNIHYGRPGADARGSRARRARRAHPRLHRGAARRLRNRSRRARPEAVRRREAARRDRARAAEEPGDPDLRRGDLGARFALGAGDPGRARPHRASAAPRWSSRTACRR